MESVQLSRRLSVTRLGFGGCPLGGHGWGEDFQATEGMDAVRRARDHGVTFFDTADVYGLGQSERLLSEALGTQRHDAVIATKFGVRWDEHGSTTKDLSLPYLRSALESSLRRLRLESIPLYYVHWPDHVTPIVDVIGELERCQEEGKIQAIGVSNFSAQQLEQACSVTQIAAVQFQCSLVDREQLQSLVPVARKHGVKLVAWGALAQGLLTGKFDGNASFAKGDRRHRYENFNGAKFEANLKVVDSVRSVAAKSGRSPAQVAIRWLLDSQNIDVVLFGAKRPRQVDDNVGSARWSLDDESCQELDDLDILSETSAA